MAKLFYFHPSQAKVEEEKAPADQAITRRPHSRVRRLRVTVYVIVLIGLCVLLWAKLARAGNPDHVAGISYFNAGVAGQPLTWTGGAVAYYTDQGDLSPVLPGPDADAFVADAFSRWTSIPTAAISAIRAGQLAEDVSGANVILNSDRSITLPADIAPDATTTPIGI